MAETLGVTRARVSKMAGDLVAKSLVRRRPDNDDGRAHTLELTKHGNALVPKLAALTERADAEFFAGLQAGERNALIRALEKFD
jgi:DNA-binding MarR family transcriptional regulator